jgi:hypothetical protein
MWSRARRFLFEVLLLSIPFDLEPLSIDLGLRPSMLRSSPHTPRVHPVASGGNSGLPPPLLEMRPVLFPLRSLLAPVAFDCFASGARMECLLRLGLPLSSISSFSLTRPASFLDPLSPTVLSVNDLPCMSTTPISPADAFGDSPKGDILPPLVLRVMLGSDAEKRVFFGLHLVSILACFGLASTMIFSKVCRLYS